MASIILTCVFLLLIASSAAAGPIFPSRKIIVAPKFRSPHDTVRGVKFLRQHGIWGDIFRGINSTADRFYWSISTGGVIQIAEWDESMLFLVGDYEMTADQHSSISFNPRGIFWTEGLLYGMKFGETELYTGYINRCHHDIDNLEQQVEGNGEERTLIYSSVLANAVWRDVNLAGVRSDLSAQFDYYVFKQDYLIPTPSVRSKTNFEDAIASISLSGKFDLLRFGDGLAYLRSFANTALFKNTMTFDSRIELGAELHGDALTMDIYIGYETLQDDASRPSPVNSGFPYIGFRFIGKNIGM